MKSYSTINMFDKKKYNFRHYVFPKFDFFIFEYVTGFYL